MISVFKKAMRDSLQPIFQSSSNDLSGVKKKSRVKNQRSAFLGNATERRMLQNICANWFLIYQITLCIFASHQRHRSSSERTCASVTTPKTTGTIVLSRSVAYELQILRCAYLRMSCSSRLSQPLLCQSRPVTQFLQTATSCRP